VMKLNLSTLLLLGYAGLLSLAQQIQGSLFALDLLGLSDGCLTAVNNTITSCPAWLPEHVNLGYVLMII